MAEQTHTPGPWEYNADFNEVQGEMGLPVICQIGITHGAATEEERTANARLIAAAPDLLAALEALWTACCAADEDLPDQIDGSLLDAASAALAKAEGGG